MTRQLLTIVLPFLTPFVAYLIYWWSVRRRQLMEAQGRKVSPWEDFPWAWIVTSGAVLTALALVVMALWGGGEPFATYQTPRFEGGVIIPGRVGQ